MLRTWKPHRSTHDPSVNDEVEPVMGLFRNRGSEARKIADEPVVTWKLDSPEANRRAADAVDDQADRLEAAGDRRGAEESRSWARAARDAAAALDIR